MTSQLRIGQSLTPEQVRSLPRVASEIEKRAALALAEMSVLDLREVSQANGVEIMWTDVAETCREYLQAHDYARSIGAIE